MNSNNKDHSTEHKTHKANRKLVYCFGFICFIALIRLTGVFLADSCFSDAAYNPKTYGALNSEKEECKYALKMLYWVKVFDPWFESRKPDYKTVEKEWQQRQEELNKSN
ncbi:MAG: hypothetical protein JXR97_13645 [Planctomycetes bacterium]|nr:hypothetical protein [Planctomycetota bacterium]